MRKKEFIYTNGNQYHIIDLKQLNNDEYTFNGVKKLNGDIAICTSFYDGGCDLSEAIESYIKDAEL